jgi:outer membrane receptor for ferrienterochelin and colicins
MKLKQSTLLVVSVIYAGSTLAADDSFKLDQLVVTPTKTERPIDKVTAAVEVVTESEIQKMGASTLKDIFEKTPGLILQYGTFPSGSSASKSSVNIRGVGATGSLWLIDGRRLAGEVKNPYDMDRIPASMIERIEIVKGPMSALYGADAVGGVINIITKQPKDGFSGSITTSLGQNTEGDGGNRNISASVRGGKGNFRGSFYVSRNSSDPYSETEKSTTRMGGGKHTISAKPPSPDGIPPMPGYLNPNGPTGGKPFYLQADGSVKPMPIDPSKLASDKDAAQQAFTAFRANALNNIPPNYDVDVTYREESIVNTVGGRGEFDVNDQLTLGAEFNWFDENRDGVYRAVFHPMGYMPPVGHKTNPIAGHDANGNPIGKRMGAIPAWDVPVNSNDENERMDVAVDATYDVDEDLDVKFRVYRSYYEKRNTTTMNQWADFGYPNEAKSAASGMSANVDIRSYEITSNWQANDDHLLTGGAEYRTEKREATVFDQTPGFDTREVEYRALYLQDDFVVDDTLSVTIGGRYDQYDQMGYTDANGMKRDSDSESETTFRVGAVKNISEMVNLRANIAQGFRVPDIREQFIQKQTPAGLQLGAQAVLPSMGKEAYDLVPEKTVSYEIGVSGANSNFNYSAAAFYNEIEDKIEQVTRNNGSGSYFTFENLDDATTQGVEVAVGYKVTDRVTTDFSWTELRTENTKTGDELEFNPERVVSAAVDFDVTDRLNLGANITYTGEQFYTENNGMVEKSTDGYTITNMNVGYSIGKDREIDLFAGVNNVFDTEVDKRLGSNVGTYYFAGVKANF